MRAQPYEDVLYRLSVRLRIVVTDLYTLTIPQLARYLSILTEEAKETIDAPLRKSWSPEDAP